MKELSIKAVDVIYDNRIVCPHCSLSQVELDEAQPGTYECENCWNAFAITQNLLNTKKEVDLTEINENLEELHKRLKIVEKQLGIR